MEGMSIVRRKRTKRQTLLLSSVAAADVVTSSSTSAEFSPITAKEEEDIANWLVLFARGGRKPRSPEPKTTTVMRFASRQFAEAATTTSGMARLDVHECKTCNKCFPSFQAFCGHRACHKKIKLSIPTTSADETKTAVMSEDSIQLSLNSYSLKVAATARIHECSICGTKFNSGQALGSHMRRHHPVNPQVPAKEGNSNDFL